MSEPSPIATSSTSGLFSAAAQGLPEASVAVLDLELRLRVAYGEALSLGGWSTQELHGKTVGQVLPPAQLALLEPLFRGALAGGRGSVEVLSLDGTRTLWTRVAPVEEDGAIIGVVALSVDITDRKRAEDERRRLVAIAEQSHDAIIAIDEDHTILVWNAGAERLMHYGAREAVGAPLKLLVPADGLQAELDVWDRIHAGETVERRTRRLRQDGTLVDVSVIGSPIRDADGAVIGASEIARDISEQQRAEAKLEHMADHDSLTGLLNRRAFEEQLSLALGFARRYGMTTTLLMIDIDRFKEINDTYGHAVGDAILCRVANLMRGRLRVTDVIARLGGDEFAVILPGLTSADGRRVTKDLLGMLRSDATTRVQGQVVSVSASVGLVDTDRELELSPLDLLAEADVSLYEAKEAGGGTVSVTDRKRVEATGFEARLNWAERIRKSLEEHRFVLFEQPIVTLGTGQMDRRELLLRMPTEQHGLVGAGVFLPIAERFDQTRDIDVWVIRHALNALASQNGDGDAGRVHINLAAASTRDPGLLSIIAQAIAAADVEPSRLVFEIAETSALQSLVHDPSLASQLSALGCEVAIDGFGSGFTSFSALEQLPFDYLKIDSGLIGKLSHSHADRIAVRAIVEMAHGLGKATIAKGVEDESTLDIVRELGIDYAQGFHVGRPGPAGERTRRLGLSR